MFNKRETWDNFCVLNSTLLELTANHKAKPKLSDIKTLSNVGSSPLRDHLERHFDCYPRTCFSDKKIVTVNISVLISYSLVFFL